MNRIFILYLLLLFSSCVDDELCVGEGTNIIKVKFYDINDPTTQLAVTLDEIEVSGDPEAFPVYADSTLSAMNLTIDPNELETTYIIHTATRSDTLKLGYYIQSKLISPACGPELLFSQLEVIQYSLDSIYLEESQIKRETETNIRIYY